MVKNYLVKLPISTFLAGKGLYIFLCDFVEMVVPLCDALRGKTRCGIYQQPLGVGKRIQEDLAHIVVDEGKADQKGGGGWVGHV